MEAPPPLAPNPPIYHDRSTGLMVFGILEIILGGFCALMLPLSLFGQVIAARKAGHPFDFPVAMQVMLPMLAGAIGLIWLGIGSIRARRWARALLLCLGVIGLCAGLGALAVIIPALGAMDAMMRQQGHDMTTAAIIAVKIFVVAVIFVMYVLIPGALVLFYRSAHVKVTCENRNPAESWTDRCPLPVLAISLLQVWGALYVLLMPRFGGAMPLAGFLVTGWCARILWLGFAVFSLWAARGFYRLNYRVWLVYLVVILAFGLSSVATFARNSLMDYYHAIALPEWQMQQMAHSPFAQGHAILWLSGFSLLLYGGYLLYLRRYFLAARDHPGAV